MHPQTAQPNPTLSWWKSALAIVLGSLLATLASGAWERDPPGSTPLARHGYSLSFSPASLGGSAVDLHRAADLLIEAIIQIESAGNPRRIGSRGERGLMQIMPGTWAEVTQRTHGRRLPFDLAFDPETNRQVGRQYLSELQAFLYQHQSRWKSDLRSLLLACYNAGPQRVAEAGFDLRRLPRSVRDYADRGGALHDWHLAHDAQGFHALLYAER